MIKDNINNEQFNALLRKRKRGRKDVEDFDINTMIFNDPFFMEINEKYMRNKVDFQEAELYRAGRIRKIYVSFEQLILDNIEYYSRIIRTVYLLFENRNVQDGQSKGLVENPYKGLTRTLYKNRITPTQLYYIALLPPDFLYQEFHIAFPDVDHEIDYTDKLTVTDRGRMLVHLFSNHNRFKLLHELARLATGSDTSESYSSVLAKDKTSFRYLKTILPYKYQKAISLAFSGSLDDAQEFSEEYGKYLGILRKFGTVLPDQYTSIRTDALYFYDMESLQQTSFDISGDYVLRSTGVFPKSILEYYHTFIKFLESYHPNIKFLQYVLQEMLKSRESLPKFYGIKSLSNGSVSSVRVISRHGAIDIKETMFDSQGNVIQEIVSMRVKTIARVAEVIVSQFNYYVFDVEKVNVINTNLKDAQAVLNHITEVSARYQPDVSDLNDRYTKEARKVMDEYIEYVREIKNIN